jgi:hypothetical protein
MDRHLDNAFRSTQPRHGEAAQHQKDEALDGAGVQRSSTQKKQKEEEEEQILQFHFDSIRLIFDFDIV